MPRPSAAVLWIGLILPAALSCGPRPLGIGNILVSTRNTIAECTKDGDLVQP
jgi:hypothetical protein